MKDNELPDEITSPILAVFYGRDGEMRMLLHPPKGISRNTWAMLLADIIRMSADCMEIDLEKMKAMVQEHLKTARVYEKRVIDYTQSGKTKH